MFYFGLDAVSNVFPLKMFYISHGLFSVNLMLIDVNVKIISKTFLLTNHISVIRDLGANQWAEADILSFAAGVESNTNHPLGKAIMEAAGTANCIIMKVIIAEVCNKCELRMTLE